MSNDTAIRKWSDIYNAEVAIPGEGRMVGKVVDFYLKTETNAIYALGIRTRLADNLALPVTGVKGIDGKTVNIISEQMLTRALPPLLRGQHLRGLKIVGEGGKEVGTVGEVWLATENPILLRLVALERAADQQHQARKFTANEIARYDDDAIVIFDHVARRLEH